MGAKTGLYAAPVRVGAMPNTDGMIKRGQTHRIYDVKGKGVTLTARSNGGGVAGPLYAMPTGMAWRGRGYEMRRDQKSNAVIVGHQHRLVIDGCSIFQLPHGYNRGGCKYDKTPTLTSKASWIHNNFVIESAHRRGLPVYEVKGAGFLFGARRIP